MTSSKDNTPPQAAAATNPVATMWGHDTAYEATSVEPELPWWKQKRNIMLLVVIFVVIAVVAVILVVSLSCSPFRLNLQAIFIIHVLMILTCSSLPLPLTNMSRPTVVQVSTFAQLTLLAGMDGRLDLGVLTMLLTWQTCLKVSILLTKIYLGGMLAKLLI